jgi:hypothetical protein
MSEMRRAARALVERRTERFESRHDLDASKARLARALERARLPHSPTFEASWIAENGQVVLEARFLPHARTIAMLQVLSLAMVALVALSAWTVTKGDEGALRFLVPLFTVLAILALPFVSLALASSREAREARIRKAIRIALMDEDEAFPPQQRWADED